MQNLFDDSFLRPWPIKPTYVWEKQKIARQWTEHCRKIDREADKQFDREAAQHKLYKK